MNARPQVDDGRRRAVIEDVRPQVDGGRFPIKRVRGETVDVEALVFTDGHDAVRAVVRHRREDQDRWQETPMHALGNDRWRGSFEVGGCGRVVYRVRGWVDPFETWRRDLVKRMQAAQDLTVPLQMGIDLIEAARSRADGPDAERLGDWAGRLTEATDPIEVRAEAATGDDLAELVVRHPDLELATESERDLVVVVEPEIARFSTWYELFPRSCGPGERHGTFADVETRLDDVAAMGFDVLYLPPVHPIGRTHRKGPNNTLQAGPEDPGSPWAIGAEEGGHLDLHPALGGLEQFRRLVDAAHGRGLKIALDIAFQCSPDHPWVTEHPEWFVWRPDGTIQYAENPPKKYQDIYPLNFESEDWRGLWAALRDVFLYWIDQGVKIFRVDNPHTKAFGFWEWAIAEIKREHPETVFLSEAFTRPPVLHRLAKLGFSQSYNYFPWRNTKYELTRYLTELTAEEGREYLRPNLWPNTPDILPEFLQYGGRAGFAIRLVLAATLGASYGIYGPAFELLEDRPRQPGSEEYLDSEKYQIRDWDLGRADSLRELIALVNRLRHEHRALQSDWSLRFHEVDNEQLIAYSKHDEDGGDAIFVVVNLDPHHVQRGWVRIPLVEFGILPHQSYQMHDLVSGARFLWTGERNYVEIDPHALPAHVFQLRRRVRTERDFDYFL